MSLSAVATSAGLLSIDSSVLDYSSSTSFVGDHGQEILRIGRDGKVTFPSGAPPDQAAAEIWKAFEAMGALEPKPCKPINANALISFAIVFAFGLLLGRFCWRRR